MDRRCERNYTTVGFNFMASGEQGGDLNASWEAQEEMTKCWLGLVLDSFGLSLFFLGGLMFPRSMLHNTTTFLLFCKVSMVVWSAQCDAFGFAIRFCLHTPNSVCVGFV